MIDRASAPNELEPGRLWSLWDMLNVNGKSFYRAVTFCKHIETINESFENDLNRKHQLDDNIFEAVPDEFDSIIEWVTQLRVELIKLDTKLSLMTVNRLIESLESRNCTYKLLGDFAKSLNGRLADELSLISLYVIDDKSAAYYEPSAPHFGTGVETKFPTASYEIEEAGKCLGLSRPTAAVFHLMRTMEIGVKAVARCLSIPDPLKQAERSWGNVLKAIKDDLDAHGGQSPKKKWGVSGDREFFEGVYTSLDAVKVGWRNTTMHVENKYTDEEAEHIFSAVKIFMKKLASRMDEDGKPLA